MGFISVKTYNFRNLTDQELLLKEKDIFLIGENGQGKTNFLEAVYLLCYGSSFRTKEERLLYRYGEREMSVSGVYRIDNEYEIDVKVKSEGGRKGITVDGKTVADRKDLIKNIPCIVFSHEDIEFVKGPPCKRRQFFNQVLSLHDPFLIEEMRRYRKVVRNRNILLRDGVNDDLEAYDYQLALNGLEIQRKRKSTVDEFNSTFKSVFANISKTGDKLKIVYAPSWKNLSLVEEVMDFLRKKRKDDTERGVSTTGPHRDRFYYIIHGKDFSKTASTGQLRLISLVLRVSQAVFFLEKTGKKPILLIDDVLLELDSAKKERFIESLPPYEQAFFTFLPEENILRYYSGKKLIFDVKNGNIIKRGV